MVIKGNHAPHAFIDVVAVQPHKQHHHRGNCRPNYLQGQIAFDGSAIAQIPGATPKTHHGVNQQPRYTEKQHRADAEQYLK